MRVVAMSGEMLALPLSRSMPVSSMARAPALWKGEVRLAARWELVTAGEAAPVEAAVALGTVPAGPWTEAAAVEAEEPP